jgi:hypothetical protein
MNKQVVVDVFSAYETIKDSMKVTRRSINKNLFTLHYQTDFFAEGKDDALDKMVKAENELDDIMVLSIFASFERELRASIQDVVVANMSVINKTVERINLATVDSIERWTVTDIIDILKDVVPDELRGRAKQIYEYRNWVAHGRNKNHLPSSRTDPKTAYAVLSDFIDMAKDAI